MKSFRVAICLSGQARTWKSTHESFRRFFNAHTAVIGEDTYQVQVDYFCHTWKTNTWYRNYDTVPDGELISEVICQTELDELIKAYSPISYIIEDQIPRSSYRYFNSLFCSFSKSIFLKREYELANGFEYDLVIKGRYDAIFSPKFRFGYHAVDPLVAYTSSITRLHRENYGINFDDVVFYGNSVTMDLIADLYWEQIKRISEKRVDDLSKRGIEHPGLRMGPGVALYNHMVATNIQPVVYHNDGSMQYAIVRERAAHLEVDEDFYKILDIFYTGKKY